MALSSNWNRITPSQGVEPGSKPGGAIVGRIAQLAGGVGLKIQTVRVRIPLRLWDVSRFIHPTSSVEENKIFPSSVER